MNSVDRHCTNTPQACYHCCSSHADILTCSVHFKQMGNTGRQARLASGLVHPSVRLVSGLAPEAKSELSEDAVDERADSDPLAGGLQSASDLPGEAAPDVELLPAPRPPQPAGDAVIAPAATAASIAAMRAAFEADRAAAETRERAVQVQLNRQAADTRRILAMLTGLQLAAPAAPQPGAPPQPLQSAAVPALPQQPRSAVAPAPPHRGAVLGPGAAALAAVNMYAALADGDSDNEAHEVPPHSHIRTQPTAVLPAAFVPTPSGTEQSAQQQLAAILSGLSKQGAKVRYANIAELDEALDDWAADALRGGQTAAQIESIRAYQGFLIDDLTRSRHWPLKDVLEYHRKWCKAVHSGTVDMFAPRAWRNHDILDEVAHPKQYGGAAPSTAAAHRPSKPKGPAKAGQSATTNSSPAAAKHPAGSCVNHPTSTSHTTAECLKK